MRRPAMRPASDAKPFRTNHRILNPTIPKNPAAAPHHARGLAIAPGGKVPFHSEIGKRNGFVKNAFASHNTQILACFPRQLGGVPFLKKLISANQCNRRVIWRVGHPKHTSWPPATYLVFVLTQHRTSEGRHPTYNRRALPWLLQLHASSWPCCRKATLQLETKKNGDRWWLMT